MTFIPIIKFIHVLLAMSLLSLVLIAFFSLKFHTKTLPRYLKTINWLILGLVLIAGGSGISLVLPRHYTFHTPWISAALILFPLFASLLIIAKVWKRKLYSKEITRKHIFWSKFIYLLLAFILICLIHDAVMKQSLFGEVGLLSQTT